ncbi:MAG: hypothetical protein MJZ37_02630 [Bacilli bacterium]|nr:hypothetical protein [Bacilli bacterium]
MALTEEQIARMMTKHITCKTVLVDPKKEDESINQHMLEGWEVASKVDCNGRVKITYRKVKKLDDK